MSGAKFQRYCSRQSSANSDSEPVREEGILHKEMSVHHAQKRMKSALEQLQRADEELTAAMAGNLMRFEQLFARYLALRTSGKTHVDCTKARPPAAELVFPYGQLVVESVDARLLDTLAVLKLNGGLGTSMGCVGPKSMIEVHSGHNFLDLTVQQIELLNKRHGASVPLLLMNSFNTDASTSKFLQNYSLAYTDILTFNQSQFPRFYRDTLLPVPTSLRADDTCWYPPGHGDVFQSLESSGMLDWLIENGREYLFFSNIDNLGATVDPAILQYMQQSGCEFLMEVTEKTAADIKGGTLIEFEGRIRLLELAQVPPEFVQEFKSIKRYKIFNTNNLWVSTRAIKRFLSRGDQDRMDVIVNPKGLDGSTVIQLETAAGAAIEFFESARGINVPRSRFLPVKTTSDLLALQSNLYRLVEGCLTMNPMRSIPHAPIVKLGKYFTKVADFQRRVGSMDLVELEHLTVSGDVYFGDRVTLKGTVIIVAEEGSRIMIPNGSVLENKVLSGSLSIVDH